MNKVDTPKSFKPKRESHKPQRGSKQPSNVIPPQLPKEYYDSMLEAYKHEEERVRDI